MSNQYEKATAIDNSFVNKFVIWFLTKKLIIVYTMGKVGSSTIVQSLRNYGLNEIQPHTLTFHRKGSYFVKVSLSKREKIINFIKTLLKRVKVFFWKATFFFREVKFITVVREPISRNISAFFEQIEYIDSDWYNKSIEDLIEMFWKYGNHDASEIWFDAEFNEVFGIDVYEHEFDYNKNFLLINKGNKLLLILKLEKLNSLDNEIGEFLGICDFKIASTNRSDYKVYHKIYQEFKEKIVIPQEYIDKVYTSKYMRHFYSKIEIDRYKKKYNVS